MCRVAWQKMHRGNYYWLSAVIIAGYLCAGAKGISWQEEQDRLNSRKIIPELFRCGVVPVSTRSSRNSKSHDYAGTDRES